MINVSHVTVTWRRGPPPLRFGTRRGADGGPYPIGAVLPERGGPHPASALPFLAYTTVLSTAECDKNVGRGAAGGP